MKKLLLVLFAFLFVFSVLAASKMYKKTHVMGNFKFAILQTLDKNTNGFKITAYNKKGKKLASEQDSFEEDAAEGGYGLSIIKSAALQSETGGADNFQILIVFALGRSGTEVAAVNFNTKSNKFSAVEIQKLSANLVEGKTYAEKIDTKNNVFTRELTFFKEDDPTCCPSGDKKLIEYEFDMNNGDPRFLEEAPPEDKEDGEDTE